MRCLSLLTLALTAASQVRALSVQPGNDAVIIDAAGSIASTLMGFYNPATPGVLPAPYGWWEAGAMWSGMIQYWHYTGDATYNDVVSQALVSRAGPGNDFMGPQCEGNDDQGWWALAAMSAAEYGLPQPAGSPAWLSLAENVFNEMTGRWGSGSCNGGMKWKIAPSAGYDYKSSIANGVFFQLSARLARLTGDPKYVDWAENVFDWMQAVGLIDGNYNVFDGTDDTKGCIDVDHDKWTYNTGVFLYGSAVLQDHTGDAKWATRTNGLIGAASSFFQSNILVEKCETDNSCDTDQLSFKAYLARWMAATAIMVPSTQGAITPLLAASATGAGAACDGPNTQCGMRWTIDKWDGTQGVGQQLAALEVVHGLLYQSAAAPTAKKLMKRSHPRDFSV
jgi:mannan endo-1,6-alpha-mannosidase